MEEIQSDPRFAHIATDPRFRPMPKSKRKVKIDSRFQSLFTNRHFSHKTETDKRGRPVINQAKKNKHVMQRFYELSSESESESEESEEEEPELKAKESGKSKQKGANKNKLVEKVSSSGDKKSSPKKKRKVEESDIPEIVPAKKKKQKNSVQDEDDVQLQEKIKKANKLKAKPITAKGKKNVKQKAPSSDEEDDDDEENNFFSKASEDDEEESDDSTDDDESEDDDEEEEEEEENLPEFTKEYELEETEIDHKWNELQNDAEVVSESTHRLAVCNMDWDFIKAQDLFVLFKSFVPEGGSVKSVAIYPSEFGKERMKEEALLGPKEIREGKIEEEDERKGKDSKKKKDQKKIKESVKEREALQREKLREYQLNRLKYYYAVVDCDSVATADSIYKECDGREYQLSNVQLDLRFIPDDMTFDDEPREVFSETQSVVDYQPANFNSTALSQAKVEVTWDETEFDRLGKRMMMLQQKELESIVEENKYSDIIAPPESDSEDEDGRPEWLRAILTENGDEDDKEITEEEKIRMYRNVLMEKKEEEEEEKRKDEEDVDKVLEWQPGLKSSVETKLKQKSKKKEETTVVNEYLEKRKEKKKKKKAVKLQARQAEEGDQAFSDDEIPDDVDLSEFKDLMEEENLGAPKSQKKKKKKKMMENNEDEMDEKERAELELMLMDDGTKHIAKPELVTEEKKKSKKTKKKLAMQKKKEEQEKEDFVLDVEDDRFSALYTSRHFHIDPNAPQFKKTKNMLRLVDEQIKRKQKSKSGNKNSKEKQADQEAVSDNTKDSKISNSKSVSQSLIESLKRKMKKK